jgi:hypothetical protein
VIGGRSEIRTHGGLAPTAVFKTAALNHSAILPTLTYQWVRRSPCSLHVLFVALPCVPPRSLIGFRRFTKPEGGIAEPNLFKREDVWWLRAKVNGHRYLESMRTSDIREARRLRDKRLKEIRSDARRSHIVEGGRRRLVAAFLGPAIGKYAEALRRQHRAGYAVP